MDKNVGLILVCILVLIAIILSAYDYIQIKKSNAQTIYEAGYLDACKDFYNGKLKYNLITNPDGTHEWKKVSK